MKTKNEYNKYKFVNQKRSVKKIILRNSFLGFLSAISPEIAGAMYPTAWVETLRLMKYLGSDGNFVRLFEVLFVVFTFLHLLSELHTVVAVGFLFVILLTAVGAFM